MNVVAGKSYYPVGLSKRTSSVKIVDDMCKGAKPECDVNSPYRTFDGKCNNPIEGREFWGAASTPFRRGTV